MSNETHTTTHTECVRLSNWAKRQWQKCEPFIIKRENKTRKIVYNFISQHLLRLYDGGLDWLVYTERDTRLRFDWNDTLLDGVFVCVCVCHRRRSHINIKHWPHTHIYIQDSDWDVLDFGVVDISYLCLIHELLVCSLSVFTRSLTLFGSYTHGTYFRSTTISHTPNTLFTWDFADWTAPKIQTQTIYLNFNW